MAWRLAVGFDRADGVTPLPLQPTGSGGGSAPVGTPTPANALLITDASGTSNISTNEEPDSPEIERAEQATFQHRFKMAWASCLAFIPLLGRGTFVTDSFGNIWRILSSKIQSMTGTAGSLSITAESISFDSPPDDYQMLPVELGIDLIKHPRYAWALLPFPTDQSTSITVGDTIVYYTQLKESIVRMIQMYRDSPYYPSADYVNGLIQNNILTQLTNGFISVTVPNPNFVQASGQTSIPPPVAWDGTTASLAGISTGVQSLVLSVPCNLSDPTDAVAIAIAAAKELLSKLWRQEDTPYIVGYEVTWTQYYFAPVYENPGGYLENPVGIVPDYFISPSQNGSNTIFDQIAAINPQCYSQDGTASGSVDFSSLRKADEVNYQRTWFAITRKWVLSPVGNWDNQLYLGIGESRPQNANDFSVIE